MIYTWCVSQSLVTNSSAPSEMAEKGAAHLAPGMCLPCTMRDSHSVRDLKQMYCKAHPGTSLDEIVVTYSERVLESNDQSITEYGMRSGDYYMVSLGESEQIVPESRSGFGAKRLTIVRAESVSASRGKVDTIRIHPRPDFSETFPVLEFNTIRLSCETHPYSYWTKRYAGFILYGWRGDDGKMRMDWTLGGKHCKSAYMVIQNSDSNDVKRYQPAAPGQIHGAVYWNVFGRGAEPSRAVGEGFSVEVGWVWNSFGDTSGVFNGNTDAYRDSKREMAELTKKCVKKIEKDWQKNSSCGKTYYVKDLLN